MMSPIAEETIAVPNHNVLFIMSDEHSRRVLGCYGNDIIRTPHLDRLAEQGTLFENAYCNCPICVPSRASFATGRYVHQVGCWDNAIPYTGTPPSFGHRLHDTGHRCNWVGKLHYRASDDPNGFDNEILPLHVLNGQGDVQGMLRSPPPLRPSTKQLAGDAGPGESTYLAYDRNIRDAAIDWLGKVADAPPDKPWCLFVSFVCPHFPLVAPPEFFALYPPESLPLPRLTGLATSPTTPCCASCGRCRTTRTISATRRMCAPRWRRITAWCRFLTITSAGCWERCATRGLERDTLVIYSSDHGDNLGTRSFWGKSNMYDESAGVPLIMRGPGVAAGKRVATPVSLVDSYPTIIETVGESLSPEDRALPGVSLLRLAEGADADRTVLSEYHAVGSLTGMFMLRFGRWKYVHYEGYRSQLFDLEADPGETRDLALEPGHAAMLAEGERRLRAICDPSEVNARAFADQAARIAELGGEAVVRKAGSYPYTPAPGEKPRIAV